MSFSFPQSPITGFLPYTDLFILEISLLNWGQLGNAIQPFTEPGREEFLQHRLLIFLEQSEGFVYPKKSMNLIVEHDQL